MTDIVAQLAGMDRGQLEGVRAALLSRADERVPVAVRIVEAEIWIRRQTALGRLRVNDKRFVVICGRPAARTLSAGLLQSGAN